MTDVEHDPAPEEEHVRALRAVREELARLEDALLHGQHPADRGARRNGGAAAWLHRPHAHRPAWLRQTNGETRIAVTVAVLATIGLQVALPERLAVQPIWLPPVLELVLFGVLITANPVRIQRESRWLRAGGLTLTGLISLANAYSAVLLVFRLVRGEMGENAGLLLASGGAIWLTNVIVFALWYWELDRGGPVARAHARRTLPDFQFAQMQNPELAAPDWEPAFVDYLYLSFTNATAFSPTDVLPLSRWAKLAMLLQSAVSLVTVALVIARAVNILK